jgi:hypothetical protein
MYIIKKGCDKKVSVSAVKKPITSTTLNFVRENVLSITDLTRTNKLSEILNRYAGEETEEVFIIQNNKNRDAIGVLVDLEHYQRLLRIQEAVEQSMDEAMYQIAMERIDEKADIPLTDVIEKDDFELNNLLESLPAVELDED